MIGYIRGKIIGKNEDHILLENSGIGYKIFTTPSVIEKQLESVLELYTYLQVREDAMNLFGFATKAEQEFFELLLTVSGVGPKGALAVLSAGDMDMVKQAIASQDAAVFTRVSGIGKKTAERIIVELKEKITVTSEGQASFGPGSEDLFAALDHLGYSNKEIKEVIKKLDHSLGTEEKLRQALRLLGRV